MLRLPHPSSQVNVFTITNSLETVLGILKLRLNILFFLRVHRDQYLHVVHISDPSLHQKSKPLKTYRIVFMYLYLALDTLWSNIISHNSLILPLISPLPALPAYTHMLSGTKVLLSVKFYMIFKFSEHSFPLLVLLKPDHHLRMLDSSTVLFCLSHTPYNTMPKDGVNVLCLLLTFKFIQPFIPLKLGVI